MSSLKEKRQHKRILRQSVAKASCVEDIVNAIEKASTEGDLSEVYIALVLGIDTDSLRRFCRNIRFDKDTYLFYFPRVH